MPAPGSTVIGLIAGFLLFPILVLLYDLAIGGLPALPRCRSGRCRAGEYVPARLDDRFFLKCKCGDHYFRAGRRFFQIVAGKPAPYMRWRAFRRWARDEFDAVPGPPERLSNDVGVEGRLLFFLNYSASRLYLRELSLGYVQNTLKLFCAPREFLAWAWPTRAAWVGIGMIILG